MIAAVALACGLASGQASAEDAKQFSGLAAHYGRDYEGVVTAGGDYDPKKFTAAHRTLPFGTRVRVTDIETKRSVEVVVNDRGPFLKERVIDVSYAAAKALKMTGDGLIKVTVVVLAPTQLTTTGIAPAP